MHWRWEAPASL